MAAASNGAAVKIRRTDLFIVRPIPIEISRNAPPRESPCSSAGEEYHPGSVAFQQLLVAGVEDGVHCLSQSDVCGIVGGEVVPQLPNPANQWLVRVALRRQRQ